MGTPVYSNEGDFEGMETGIDYEKFFNLKFDNIILPGLGAIFSGDFIKGGEGALLWNKNSHLSSVGNFAILLGINGLSTNAMLELPVKNNNFLSASTNCEVSIASIYNWAELENTIDELTGRPKYYSAIQFV